MAIIIIVADLANPANFVVVTPATLTAHATSPHFTQGLRDGSFSGGMSADQLARHQLKQVRD